MKRDGGGLKVQVDSVGFWKWCFEIEEGTSSQAFGGCSSLALECRRSVFGCWETCGPQIFFGKIVVAWNFFQNPHFYPVDPCALIQKTPKNFMSRYQFSPSWVLELVKLVWIQSKSIKNRKSDESKLQILQVGLWAGKSPEPKIKPMVMVILDHCWVGHRAQQWYLFLAYSSPGWVAFPLIFPPE